MTPINVNPGRTVRFLEGFHETAALQAWFDVMHAISFRDHYAGRELLYPEMRLFFTALRITAPDLAEMRPDNLANRAKGCSPTLSRMRQAYEYAGIRDMRAIKGAASMDPRINGAVP